MKPNRHLRILVLFIALAATVGAGLWLEQEEKADLPSEPKAKRVAVAGDSAPVSKGAMKLNDLETLGSREVSRVYGDMFPNRSWEPPLQTPKPPPPRAPKLPFTFFGRMLENNKTVVFLTQRDQTFAVSAGDTLAGIYRVEDISPEAVTLIYLPLNERQVLSIGAIN